MKSLTTVQKTFYAFRIVSRILFILNIVFGALSAICVIAGIVALNGGQILSLFGQPIVISSSHEELRNSLVPWLLATVSCTAYAVLLGLAGNYLKCELSDGTPFSVRGIKKLRTLGIHCIWISAVASYLSKLVIKTIGIGIEESESFSMGIILGVVFMIASVVFNYGAELEAVKATQTTDSEDTDTTQYI